MEVNFMYGVRNWNGAFLLLALVDLAERMTYTSKRVTDRFFKRLKRHFTEWRAGRVSCGHCLGELP